MLVCLHTVNEVSELYIGGLERFLIKLAIELQTIGCDVFIVCSSLVQQCYIENIKVIGCIPKQYRTNVDHYSFFTTQFIQNEVVHNTTDCEKIMRAVSAYAQEQLNHIEADIYHFNSFISASYIDDVRILSRCLVTNHDNDLEMNQYWGEKFYAEFAKLVFHRKTNLHLFKMHFVPSNYYAEKFSTELKLRISNIPLGVDINHFSYSSNHCSYANSMSNQHIRKITILLPSRLRIHQKGHDIALEACYYLKQKHVNFNLIITGIAKSLSSEANKLWELIKQYNLQENIVLRTFGDMKEAYNECDIVISPERYCSYGLSISESLSLGIPTVLSDIPTYQEIARGFKHSIFFKSESAQALSDAIIGVNLSRTAYQIDACRFRTCNDMRECARKYFTVYDQSIVNSNIGDEQTLPI